MERIVGHFGPMPEKNSEPQVNMWTLDTDRIYVNSILIRHSLYWTGYGWILLVFPFRPVPTGRPGAGGCWQSFLCRVEPSCPSLPWPPWRTDSVASAEYSSSWPATAPLDNSNPHTTIYLLHVGVCFLFLSERPHFNESLCVNGLLLASGLWLDYRNVIQGLEEATYGLNILKCAVKTIVFWLCFCYYLWTSRVHGTCLHHWEKHISTMMTYYFQRVY